MSMYDDYDPAFDEPEEPEIIELEFPEGGEYEAHWSLSDLYPKNEEVLRKAWDTPGLDFKANLSCKKEVHYATIERVDGITTITATDCVDDLEDLIDTCIWEACGGNGWCSNGWDAICKLFDLDPGDGEDYDEICKRLDEVCVNQADNYEEYHRATVILPSSATWDELIDALDTAESKADQQADDFYRGLVESVKKYMLDAWDVKPLENHDE